MCKFIYLINFNKTIKKNKFQIFPGHAHNIYQIGKCYVHGMPLLMMVFIILNFYKSILLFIYHFY